MGAVIGVPAAIDPIRGVVVSAPVFRHWIGLEFGVELGAKLDCRVEIFQDDHLAAVGERADWIDVCAGTIVVVNIGKGIGVGCAGNGGPVVGDHGMAGRVATWRVSTVAGEVRTLSDLLTADGLAATYRRRVGAHGSVREPLSGALLSRLALRGDVVAAEVFEEAGEALGTLMVRLSTLLDPSLLVIGGGVATARDLLAPGIARALLMPGGEALLIPWVWSRLGDGAVLAGAVRSSKAFFQRWLDGVIRTALAW